MALKLENGGYVLSAAGLPVTVSGLEELLQEVRLRLNLPRGSFPYGREWGSGLAGLDPEEDHAAQRAVALANEALLDLPGVRAERAEFPEGGGIAFTVTTPLGEGEVIYGDV